MAPPPPRELVDDVISEILLRLPPDEPKWLFRAALACKPWLRTICDPAFLHRYCVFHGAPPLLGIIDRDPLIDRLPRFIATTAVPAFPIPVSDTCAALLDCRHGRVLIRLTENWGRYYLVCDPITGDRHRVPRPDVGIESVMDDVAAIFCAVTGCQHLDCHGGPFYVILMFADLLSWRMLATIYSSEVGAWSAPATLDNVLDACGRGALLGEGIYFTLSGYTHTGILKYDWEQNCLSVVEPPPLAVRNRRGRVALTVMKDSSLGLAAIQDSSLCLWSRAVSSEENAEWVQRRVIDLEKMMPMANPSVEAFVVGFTEGVGVIFISTGVGLFMMELNSGRVKKIGEHRARRSSSVLPYMSFYTPDCCRLPLRGGSADL